MTVLSDIVNADIKEDEIAVGFVVVVVCIGIIVYFRKNKQLYPDINQKINLYIMKFVVLGFIAITWITIEAVTGIPGPPLQAIALLSFLMVSAHRLLTLFDTMLTDTSKKTLMMTLAHVFLIVIFAVNQHTLLYQGDHFLARFLRTIKIPRASILGPTILAYLIIEIVFIFIHDINLYNNVNNPETIASRCSSSKNKILPLKCLKMIRYNQSTYIIFNRLLAIMVYTCVHFKYLAVTRD